MKIPPLTDTPHSISCCFLSSCLPSFDLFLCYSGEFSSASSIALTSKHQECTTKNQLGQRLKTGQLCCLPAYFLPRVLDHFLPSSSSSHHQICVALLDCYTANQDRTPSTRQTHCRTTILSTNLYHNPFPGISSCRYSPATSATARRQADTAMASVPSHVILPIHHQHLKQDSKGKNGSWQGPVIGCEKVYARNRTSMDHLGKYHKDDKLVDTSFGTFQIKSATADEDEDEDGGEGEVVDDERSRCAISRP